MRLAAARVFVTDLRRSTSWYQRCLGTVPAAGGPEAGYVVFDVGADLVLETVATDSDIAAGDLIGRFTGLSFAVADVAATVAALAEQGVRVIGPPEPQSWGGTLATVADPDGNQIQLVQYP
jgi:catechol 2,3-dioxygenase-like lactoylglutathione lyase family enzyme